MEGIPLPPASAGAVALMKGATCRCGVKVLVEPQEKPPVMVHGVVTESEPAEGSQVLIDKFEVFARGSLKRLFGRAYWRCGQWHLAQDFVQETYLRLWKVWSVQSDSITQHAAYSNKALDNVIIDYYRRKKVEEIVTETVLDVFVESDIDAGQDAVRGKILRAAAELPPQQRELTYLLYFEGLSLAEAAATMGIAEKTAYNYHSLAIKRLRKLCNRDPMKVTADRDSAETESM